MQLKEISSSTTPTFRHGESGPYARANASSQRTTSRDQKIASILRLSPSSRQGLHWRAVLYRLGGVGKCIHGLVPNRQRLFVEQLRRFATHFELLARLRGNARHLGDERLTPPGAVEALAIATTLFK